LWSVLIPFSKERIDFSLIWNLMQLIGELTLEFVDRLIDRHALITFCCGLEEFCASKETSFFVLHLSPHNATT
jgi:hypothetical protein